MRYQRTAVEIEGDKGYCTVVALSNVTGWSVDKCWRIAKDAGRVTGQGFYPRRLLDYAKKHHGLDFTTVQIDTKDGGTFYRRDRYGDFIKVYTSIWPTLAQFVKANPTGRFYLSVNGHSLALVNGVVMDQGVKPHPRYRVKRAWRIHERSIY